MPKQRVHAGSLYGSLEMLLLKTLVHRGALHGLQISECIRELSDRSLAIDAGALYPALHRLERKGHVVGEWRKARSGRRAKFYDITTDGTAALDLEVQGWLSHSRAVGGLFAALELAKENSED